MCTLIAQNINEKQPPTTNTVRTNVHIKIEPKWRTTTNTHLVTVLLWSNEELTRTKTGVSKQRKRNVPIKSMKSPVLRLYTEIAAVGVGSSRSHVFRGNELALELWCMRP